MVCLKGSGCGCTNGSLRANEARGGPRLSFRASTCNETKVTIDLCNHNHGQPAGTSSDNGSTSTVERLGLQTAVATAVTAGLTASSSAYAMTGEGLQGVQSAMLTLADTAADVASTSGTYTPSPYTPGWEIWVGFAAGVIPFLIGSYEFGKRILIQLRCELCGGRGLVPSTNPGAKYLRKCPQCGGFFPWISWKMFLSSNATPGNGGPLQQPKGQKSVFYKVPEAPSPEQVAAARERYMSEGARASKTDAGQEAKASEHQPASVPTSSREDKQGSA